MFNSNQIIDQLQRGTASEDSLKTIFQAPSVKTLNGFDLELAAGTVRRVRVNVNPEPSAKHLFIELLAIAFSPNSTVTLAQVQPEKCFDWKPASTRGTELPHRYLCIIDPDSPKQVNVLAGMTRPIEDPATHLESLTFVR